MKKQTTDRPHVSNSQMASYHRCPEAYRRRYVEKEKIPPGFALVMGSAIHSAAELNFSQKVDSHEDLPEEDIVDSAAACFDGRVESEGVELTPEEASEGYSRVRGRSLDQTVALARQHARSQAPDYQPEEVEVSTLVTLEGPRDLLVVTDLRDDQGRVTDLKTAARRPSEKDVDSNLQLTCEAAAYYADRGKLPSELRLDVLTKTKTPARHVMRTSRGPNDVRVLLARANKTVEAIEAGIFPPTAPDNWWCSSKWCGYARTCPYWSGKEG